MSILFYMIFIDMNIELIIKKVLVDEFSIKKYLYEYIFNDTNDTNNTNNTHDTDCC